MLAGHMDENPTNQDLGLSAKRTAVHSPVIPALSMKVPKILYFDIFPTKKVFICWPSGCRRLMVKARKSPSLWPKSISSFLPLGPAAFPLSQSSFGPEYFRLKTCQVLPCALLSCAFHVPRSSQPQTMPPIMGVGASTWTIADDSKNDTSVASVANL